MRQTRSPTDADSPSASNAARSPGPDGLAFYRLLASFPALDTLRAKVAAIVIAGTFVPAFLLMLVLVLGAGRWSVLAVLGVVVVLSGIAAWAMLRALDQVLAPLDLATQAIDDVALARPLVRTDLPGNDAAAQVLRGVQALVARLDAQATDTRRQGERDDLTGVLNRRAARERAQALIDRETRRGLAVRVVLADIVAFRAFNARHGSGHGDALLKTIGQRLMRLAGESGVAARWSGDAFLLVEAAAPEAFGDAQELLGRPIVIKGSDEPVMLDLGTASTNERMSIDALVAQAEEALAGKRTARALR